MDRLDNKKIYVAGHNGMVGRSVCRVLSDYGCKNIVTASRSELDLVNQSAVREWMECNRPDVVFLCAARVGGIVDNRDHPADFIHQNLMIQTNVIHAAYEVGVEKLMFLGSSCIYPRGCPQPMGVDYLMSGALEPTNSAYAMAKLAGVEMCKSYRQQYGCDFISVMPCNLYGPYDNFDPVNSHVPAGLIQRFHNAKMNGDDDVTMWGSGAPRREFMHVDDAAAAMVFLMKNYSGDMPINIGMGHDISIQEFAELVADVVGYKGRIVNDLSYPEGVPQKLMDSSELCNMDWAPKVCLKDGLFEYYQWYKENR